MKLKIKEPIYKSFGIQLSLLSITQFMDASKLLHTLVDFTYTVIA